jgi:hypothetical protein
MSSPADLPTFDLQLPDLETLARVKGHLLGYADAVFQGRAIDIKEFAAALREDAEAVDQVLRAVVEPSQPFLRPTPDTEATSVASLNERSS